MTIERTPEEIAIRQAYRHALWGHANLSWALHERQLEDQAFVAKCYQGGVRRIVFLCGRRYGKTRQFVVMAFETALRYPGTRIPYAAKTWESAAAYVLPEARFLIENAPPDRKPVLVGGEVRFPNGSVICISGSHTEANADNLRGPDAKLAIVDEAGFNDCLDYVADSVLQAQLIKTGGLMVLGSSAPLSPSHPFVTHMKRARERKALVLRTTEDAPHLTQKEIDKFAEEIGGKSSTTWAREALCEIVTDESRAIIPEWRAHKTHVVGETPAREYRHFYVSADLGYNDGTAILLAWVDWYGADVVTLDEDGDEVTVNTGPRLVVVAESILTRPTSFDVQAAAAKLERDHGAFGRVRRRVADAPKITVADLRRLHGALRDVEGEPAAWRMPRKDDLEGAVNQVRLMVKKHQLLISPKCERLLQDVNDGVWDEKRVKFDQATETWHYDALAALVYLCRTADLTACPEPGIYIPAQARRPHPGDKSRGTLPSPKGRVSLRRKRL